MRLQRTCFNLGSKVTNIAIAPCKSILYFLQVRFSGLVSPAQRLVIISRNDVSFIINDSFNVFVFGILFKVIEFQLSKERLRRQIVSNDVPI